MLGFPGDEPWDGAPGCGPVPASISRLAVPDQPARAVEAAQATMPAVSEGAGRHTRWGSEVLWAQPLPARAPTCQNEHPSSAEPGSPPHPRYS